MTTENIVPLARDINLLMTLDTYQGMTDEEIESIIAFKIKCAIENYESSENSKALQAGIAQMIENSKNSSLESKAFLEKVKQRNEEKRITKNNEVFGGVK